MSTSRVKPRDIAVGDLLAHRTEDGLSWVPVVSKSREGTKVRLVTTAGSHLVGPGTSFTRLEKP